MSDEYIDDDSPTFSSFWPLLILLIGLSVWLAYQDYEVNAQRSALTRQFQQASPMITEAANWKARYNAMIKDLVATSGKDPAAATIAKEAVQAGVQVGLIHIKKTAPSDTNSTATPAAPSK